jgi:hypothetical protein
MKISKVQIPSFIKNVAITAPLLLATNSIKAQNNNLEHDVFQRTETVEKVAPNEISPTIKIDGKKVYPALVVDISDKQLYHYDLDGYLINSYPVRFVEDKIKPGINIIEIKEHDYDYNISSPKIILTEVKKSNGRIANTHQQVIVGSKGRTINDDIGIYTNVVLVDKQTAKTITEFLTEEQYVLIRK